MAKQFIKRVEEFIMKRYNQDFERMEIIRELATENGLTYTEAEPIVSSTILRMKHLDKQK